VDQKQIPAAPHRFLTEQTIVRRDRANADRALSSKELFSYFIVAYGEQGQQAVFEGCISM